MSDVKSFEDLNLSEMTLKALKKKGYKAPTQVQIETIPPAMKGKDVLVQARTGSGKTMAFLIPIFETIEGDAGVEALILVPTRELAQQVADEAEALGREFKLNTMAVYGGAAIDPQIRKLPKTSIVAGTPGRVIDLIKRGALQLDNLRFFVLDEADRMLDMGFLDDIKWIMSRTPYEKQMILCSATMPDEIVDLARKYMDNPDTLKLSQDDISAKGIKQYQIKVGGMNKLAKLSSLLDNEPGKYLIFCRTKIGTQRLADQLKKNGYKAFAIHGDMSQAARTRTMNDFKSGKINILVATDVAARGIDVEGITHVVNYDVPLYPKDYVHRIGRTGRMGKKGKAITFVSRDEQEPFSRIELFVDRRIPELKLKQRGRVRERMDYREYADVFGMVTLEFELKEDMKRLELIRALEKVGIRDEDIGRVHIKGKEGTIEMHYGKAHRAVTSKIFKKIRVKKN